MIDVNSYQSQFEFLTKRCFASKGPVEAKKTQIYTLSYTLDLLRNE